MHASVAIFCYDLYAVYQLHLLVSAYCNMTFFPELVFFVSTYNLSLTDKAGSVQIDAMPLKDFHL